MARTTSSPLPTGITAAVGHRTRQAKSLVSMSALVKVVWTDGTFSAVDFDDIPKMFSHHVLDWVDHHEPKVLTVQTAVRWGLVNSDGDCVQYTDDNSSEYQVAGVVLASGRLNGWTRGKYYVSSRRYGEPDTFWEAPFFTISAFQGLHRKGSADRICRYDIRTHSDQTITVEATPESQAAFLESVDDWCLSNVDWVYDLTKTGARRPSDKCESSGLLTVHPVYCKTSGYCAVASIINMLYMEEGRILARALLDLPPPEPSRKIGTLNTWMEGGPAALRREHGLTRTYSLCSLREDDGPWLIEPTDFIASAKVGKYIVRLGGFDDRDEEIDHTVYVDADRQLVFDCMEKRAIQLCYRALECCVGDAFFVGVKDVRVVVPTRLGPGNRKPRRKKRSRTKD